MKTKISQLIIISAITFGLMAGCSSCKTNGPDALVNERNAGINAAGSAALKDAGKILGNVLVTSLLQKAQGEASPSMINSAASGVWTQLSNGGATASYQDIVSSFSAGKLRQTAVEAQKAADAGLSAGHPPAAVSNAVATVLSVAAGAPPGK